MQPGDVITVHDYVTVNRPGIAGGSRRVSVSSDTKSRCHRQRITADVRIFIGGANLAISRAQGERHHRPETTFDHNAVQM